MAVETTELYERHVGQHRLNAAQCRDMERVARLVTSVEQSKAIARQHGPKVVLAASGMATGGRVLHPLTQYLGDHRNMVVLTGYQAPGTRGAHLAQGTQALRIFGQEWPVRAEVVQLTSASAHADADQLMAWLTQLPNAPHRVFVTHGDMEAADALRARIEHRLGWRAMVPEHGSTWLA
jgi:metallo-beta-lactamase family protein